MTAALDVQRLCFTYPGQHEPTVRGVSLTVAAGTSLGLLGRNGSGKSTLLNAILGIRNGTRSGEVRVDGSVGFASQRVALYRHLSVVENVRHHARLTVGRRQVAGAVDEAIDEFGLSSVRTKLVNTLSDGWQKLCHLAASFVHRPLVRILDEPTAALDMEARDRLVALTSGWRQTGNAIVITSHYPEDIEEMCTDAVIVVAGAVQLSTSIAALLGERNAQLVVETRDGARLGREVLDLPSTIGGLSMMTQTLAREPRVAQRRLVSVRTAGTSLREVLATDRRLQGVAVCDD